MKVLLYAMPRMMWIFKTLEGRTSLETKNWWTPWVKWWREFYISKHADRLRKKCFVVLVPSYAGVYPDTLIAVATILI